MKKLNIIFESPERWHNWLIKIYLKRGFKIWAVEPFYAFHHKKGIRFFPPPLPDYIQRLIKNGKINVLDSNKINAREIYLFSANKAVDVIENVYPEYRKQHETLIKYLTGALKSVDAENVFKKELCHKIAEFYSENITLNRIENFFGSGSILIYPKMDMRTYLYLKELILKSNQEIFECRNIYFPFRFFLYDSLIKLKRLLHVLIMILAQTLTSMVLERLQHSRGQKKKEYRYGITILAYRQLLNNNRGPDFIIDNKRIRAEEVAYFLLMKLTKKQKKSLSRFKSNIYYLLREKRYFCRYSSCYSEWKKLLRLVVQRNFLQDSEELILVFITLFGYSRWRRLLETITIRHFITHCDTAWEHIGRNIALSQAGVQTWYFTDSMNHIVNLKEEKPNCSMHHPLWTYLYYDHYVTWDKMLAQYLKEHPTSLKQTHIVGCLWSKEIEKCNMIRDKIMKTYYVKEDRRLFIIAAFDSSYSNNGFTSYIEGVAFAEHLFKLADNFTDIRIFLKEKKDRSSHKRSDPINGSKLIELYRKMDSHPRIILNSSQADIYQWAMNKVTARELLNISASELISAADMIISFPFTSTTFEALSINKPAIWHDPIGYYRDTPYGKVGGVTTHSYEELEKTVLEIKRLGSNIYRNPIPMDSPLMDPYRDGKALDRFRELLNIIN